jgi:hypothetical protein
VFGFGKVKRLELSLKSDFRIIGDKTSGSVSETINDRFRLDGANSRLWHSWNMAVLFSHRKIDPKGDEYEHNGREKDRDERGPTYFSIICVPFLS